jgi:hypothetical protein
MAPNKKNKKSPIKVINLKKRLERAGEPEEKRREVVVVIIGHSIKCA